MFRYFFNPGVEDPYQPALHYVLGQPLQSLGRSQGGAGQELSRKMIQYWADFAKHGDPNGEKEEDARWPVFTGPSWKYLNIEGEGESVGEDMRGQICVFWEKIIPQLVGPAPSLARARADRVPDQTCRRVRKTARLYFPGYRAMVRL